MTGTENLKRVVADTGKIPLSWAGATAGDTYVNLGDALSPVMVALLSGLPIERRPYVSNTIRMVAVGSGAHGAEGGEAHVWGSGMSPLRHPSKPDSAPYSFPPNTRMSVYATRGPLTAGLLKDADFVHRGVYGDPVWLLPRYLKPRRVEKKYELGVILHLSELSDRAYEAHPKTEFRRYNIPEALRGTVRLINTVTPVDALGLQERVEEIWSCKRIVSTSLHGMVFAESFGIPCLYFYPGESGGAETRPLDPNDERVDRRIRDLYLGLAQTKLRMYKQARTEETDWEALIAAIDRLWSPIAWGGEDALFESFPLLSGAGLPRAPVVDLFASPLLRDIPYRGDVREIGLSAKQAAQREQHLLVA